MKKSACRECHRVIDGDACPIHGKGTLTEDWRGYAVILDPGESEIAKKMKIDTPGKYALKVR
ncbi:MAG: Transcription elongation factor Spt4 [Methanonatronarchaeales archaeon]|nr:Transcription elongation factor Spt4 [Methanonatronarchaeales archaeon]